MGNDRIFEFALHQPFLILGQVPRQSSGLIFTSEDAVGCRQHSL